MTYDFSLKNNLNDKFVVHFEFDVNSKRVHWVCILVTQLNYMFSVNRFKIPINPNFRNNVITHYTNIMSA